MKNRSLTEWPVFVLRKEKWRKTIDIFGFYGRIIVICKSNAEAKRLVIA